jgi:transketolase
VSEDHYPAGGLGEAVLSTLVESGVALHYKHLAVRQLSCSGTPEELLDAAGISAVHIAAAARALLGH